MTSQKATQLRLTAGFLLAAATAFAAPDLAGLPNFQKVNDQVYRGGQPTNEGFKSLSEMGIKIIVDLREIGEHSQSEEQQIVEADDMRYISMPFKGMSAPSNEQVEKVLGLLDDSSSGPVFVHCRRGADRTGTVIACYRIAHDHWQNKVALSEAKRYGMSFFEAAMQHYVKDFVATMVASSVQSGAAALATQ